ncbi:MAG: LamG domain-containing protein, partial [Verrucomicrobiota bacterium]
RVHGRLLNQDGREVAQLEERSLVAADFARAEWLVPTGELSENLVLTPEVTVRGKGFEHIGKLPPVFLVNGWHQNAVTVKVPVRDYIQFPNELAVMWNGAQLSASITFDAATEIKCATLFRNDRPVIAFNRKTAGRTLMNLYVTSTEDYRIRLHGGEFINAVRKFTELGSEEFRVSSRQVDARKNWVATPAAFVCAIDADSSFELELPGEKTLQLSAFELNERGFVRHGGVYIETAPVDATIQNHDLLDAREGKYKARLLTMPQRPADFFYVRYETKDGRVALSSVVYPVVQVRRLVPVKLVETSINLETTSRETGMKGESEYRSDDVPFTRPKLIEAKVPIGAIRSGRWHFDGDGRDVLGDMHVKMSDSLFTPADDGVGMVLKLKGDVPVEMRLRTWPIGNATVDFLLRPESKHEKAQSILGRGGWSDGVNINLLPDGRIEVVRDGGDDVPKETLISEERLPLDSWSRVRVTNDSEHLRIYINERLDSERSIAVARSYGNSTWYLGGGYKGYSNYRGCIDELTVAGAAFQPGSPDYPAVDGRLDNPRQE